MLFRKHHIQMIIDGTKTQTRRIWKTPHAVVGRIHPARTNYYQKKVDCPKIKILKVYTQPLGEMTEEDAQKEGGYTLERFKQIWLKINRVPLDPNEVVHVVEFEYIGEGNEVE